MASIAKNEVAQNEGLTKQQKAAVEDTRQSRVEGRKRFAIIQELAAGSIVAAAVT